MDEINKTHVTLADDDDVLSTLEKGLDDMKIDDQASNEDIISYSASRPRFNKNTTVSDAVRTADGIKKFSDSETNSAENDSMTISSMPDLSTTGLME